MDLERLAKGFDFTGRCAVVTGGAGVLGGVIAGALAGLGASVAVLDLNEEAGKALIDALDAGPGRGLFVPCDVLKRSALVEAEAAVRDALGPADILVNGAGGNRGDATTNPDQSFFDLPEEALRFVLDLNLTSTVLASQVFGKSLADRGEGVILNISSMNSVRPLTRIPAYSAAKAGVSNFTLWLAVHMAREYAPGIRVNALAPGFFLTHQNRFLLTDRETGEWTERGRTILDHTPMGRFGDPEDLIGTVCFLCSPASAFITGTVIPVDGGFSAFSGV